MTKNLADYIKKLYDPELSDAEALGAQDNLVEFFKLLIEIDERLKREENLNIKT